MTNLLNSATYYAKNQEKENLTKLMFDALREFYKTNDEQYMKFAEHLQERVSELCKEIDEMLASA